MFREADIISATFVDSFVFYISRPVYHVDNFMPSDCCELGFTGYRVAKAAAIRISHVTTERCKTVVSCNGAQHMTKVYACPHLHLNSNEVMVINHKLCINAQFGLP